MSAIQAYVARASVTSSAMRGRGTEGSVECARKFLTSIQLKPFAVSNPSLFAGRLNEATDSLLAAMPPSGSNWGRARKILNIFLRNALYSTHLSHRFDLARAEPLFELPLDSFTSARLLQADSSLPRWPGVASLTPEESDRFQASALQAARDWGVASRVHLDAYWWGVRDIGPAVTTVLGTEA